jgi:hypothetical protein
MFSIIRQIVCVIYSQDKGKVNKENAQRGKIGISSITKYGRGESPAALPL